jgi:hypothetical protein
MGYFDSIYKGLGLGGASVPATTSSTGFLEPGLALSPLPGYGGDDEAYQGRSDRSFNTGQGRRYGAGSYNPITGSGGILRYDGDLGDADFEEALKWTSIAEGAGPGSTGAGYIPMDEVIDAGTEVVKDVPVIGEALGLESSAEEAAAEQQAALDEARTYEERMYDEAQGYLSPYSEAGGGHLQALSEGIRGGEFSVGKFDYQGRPVERSIESYMGNLEDNPAYQFRLNQGQKAIDRASAAGGRFGGGQTAKELMRFGQGLASQEYGNAFDRASRERQANLGAEQSRYNRAVGGYGLEQERLQNLMNQRTGMVNMGQQASGALANAALGQGSNLADIAIQQGNVAASSTMAGGNQLGQLLGLGGSAAKIYGAL